MLTAVLARSRAIDETITPLFIDPDEERYRKTARELIQLFETHLGEPKGDLKDAIDELTVADTDYKIVQRLAKLLKDECEFEVVASVEPQEIRRRLFEKANERYPIVRQPTHGEDTQKLEVYSSVVDELNISLEECYRGMYADLEDNKRLVKIGTRSAEEYAGDGDESMSTTTLTGNSDEDYEHTDLTVDWLLTRYNLALAQAGLYDATEMRIRVWDHFGTVFSYVKLFGLMHRIYPITTEGARSLLRRLSEEANVPGLDKDEYRTLHGARRGLGKNCTANAATNAHSERFGTPIRRRPPKCTPTSRPQKWRKRIPRCSTTSKPNETRNSEAI